MALKKPKLTIILTCEHSVNTAPPEARRILNLDDKLLASHRGYDAGMRESVERLAALLRSKKIEVSTYHSSVTRLVIDYNRNIVHKKQLKHVNRLSEKLRTQILTDYLNYRKSVDRQIQSALKKKHRVIVLSMHSFTPILKGKKRRTDIGLLFDYREFKERRFAEIFRMTLRQDERASELNIDFNLPYRGHTDSFSVDLNEKYRCNKNYDCLFIEYNQRHLKRFATFDSFLARAMTELVQSTHKN